MASSTEAGPPRVAVLGRQNVGKSTLVNRLHGAREAIAHEQPGVTRDRVQVPVEWRGRTFTVIDTGGYAARARGIDALVARQAERAWADAQAILLVVDAQTGVQEEDATLARRLRTSSVPVVVVANKVDSEAGDADAIPFHRLGLGEPMPVSALHGRGTGELLDRLVDLLPEAPLEVETMHEPRFALVGRPNVGKSSLFNRLVGEERAVVYEQAGTTRDAVDAVVTWGDRTVRFVDTAGLRRGTRLQGLEYYGLVRSARAIERSDVALLVVDASEGLTTDDKHIAGRVVEAGRGLVVAANKWDLLSTDSKGTSLKDLEEDLAPFPGPPIARTSALRGSGVPRLPGLLLRVHDRWSLRVPTAKVNQVVAEAQALRPPPRGVGRFLYGTQVATGPPTFVLFGGRIPDPGYRRFLENRIRSAFGFEGVPLRLRFRSRRTRGRGGRPSR
jgi:GTP-binding protein